MAEEKINYLDKYVRQIEYGQECLDAVAKMMEGAALKIDAQALAMLHEIENQADTVSHGIKNQLRIDFIVPYDRDAMSVLANALDNVIDATEDIALCGYMLCLHTVSPSASQMMACMKPAMRELAQAILGLRKKGGNNAIVQEAIVHINDYEQQCDKAYIAAVRALYEDASMDPEQRRLQHEFLKSIEHAMDCIESAGDALEVIVLQNL